MVSGCLRTRPADPPRVRLPGLDPPLGGGGRCRAGRRDRHRLPYPLRRPLRAWPPARARLRTDRPRARSRLR